MTNTEYINYILQSLPSLLWGKWELKDLISATPDSAVFGFNDLQNNIHSTTVFLEQFMENLLTGAQHDLKNRYMHVDYSETA